MRGTSRRCTRVFARGKPDYSAGESGGALLETLAAVPAVSLLLITAVFLLMASLAQYDRLSAYADLQFYARMAIDKMIEDVIQSSSVEILNNGGMLRLISSSGEQNVYYLNQQQLIRQTGGSRTPLTENTTAVEFKGISGGGVQIKMEMRKKGQDYCLSVVCARMIQPEKKD